MTDSATMRGMREDLRKAREDLQRKIDEGSEDAKAEWQRLEQKWTEFSENAELEKTSEGVGSALSQLGDELKAGYHRLKKTL